jgi:hypothetical protein
VAVLFQLRLCSTGLSFLERLLGGNKLITEVINLGTGRSVTPFPPVPS